MSFWDPKNIDVAIRVLDPIEAPQYHYYKTMKNRPASRDPVECLFCKLEEKTVWDFIEEED